MSNGVLLFVRGDGKRPDEISRAVTLIKDIAAELGRPVLISPDKTFDIGIIVAVGGDGTFLDASHEALSLDVPIAGVNAGSLGFLTEITPDEPDELRRILGRSPLIQRRIALAVTVLRGEIKVLTAAAVNELLIMRHPDGTMLDFAIRYAAMNLPHYKADGLIVATPTGSTAYNLSLNGPILFPTEHAMVVNAVAPHALTQRPLVLPSASELEIALGEETGATLSVDGRPSLPLEPGDRIVVRETPRMLRFVPSSRRTFFDVLARKLHFGRRD